jgi:hypothetical protein
MAFVIKNPSNRSGGAMLNGEWKVINPGESIASDFRPTSMSFYVKVFSVSDDKDSKSDKDSKHNRRPDPASAGGAPAKSGEGDGLVLGSPSSGGSSDSSDSAVLV